MPEFMGPHRALKTELNVPVAMRDGVTLYADIYRPDTAEPAPVLLQRTPYNKALGASRVGTLDATPGRLSRVCRGGPGHPGPVYLGGRVLPIPERD